MIMPVELFLHITYSKTWKEISNEFSGPIGYMLIIRRNP